MLNKRHTQQREIVGVKTDLIYWLYIMLFKRMKSQRETTWVSGNNGNYMNHINGSIEAHLIVPALHVVIMGIRSWPNSGWRYRQNRNFKVRDKINFQLFAGRVTTSPSKSQEVEWTLLPRTCTDEVHCTSCGSTTDYGMETDTYCINFQYSY